MGEPRQSTSRDTGPTDAGRDPVSGMTFPQLARLELDELLDQLVQRAQDVQNAHSRLRGLLSAQLLIAQGVDLDEVLRHIVQAAQELVGARYAALGVVEHGRLTRFVHSGMDEDTIARIGHLPQGKGVLGLLVDDPRPVRLHNLAEHRSAVGFPADHPPMHSFLGVPVMVRDQVYGNLYLADKAGSGGEEVDEFTADDEELVLALGAAAGIALDNAGRFAESTRRHAWQTATIEASGLLLSVAEPGEQLMRLARLAADTSQADAAGVCLSADSDPPEIAALFGAFTVLSGDQARALQALAADCAAAGHRVVVSDGPADPRTRLILEAGPELGAIVAIPMATEVGVAGALVLGRTADRGEFGAADLDLISAFAARVAVSLQLAAARRDSEQVRLLDDRLRIAVELQDRVISRLFGLGLAMQATGGRDHDPAIVEAITSHVNEIDAIIADVRAAVFSLSSRVATGVNRP